MSTSGLGWLAYKFGRMWNRFGRESVKHVFQTAARAVMLVNRGQLVTDKEERERERRLMAVCVTCMSVLLFIIFYEDSGKLCVLS